MKIKLELNREDVRELVYESFCNGGLEGLGWANILINWQDARNTTNYEKAKERLIAKNGVNKSLCREDILIEIFLNDGLYFYDYEADEDNIHFTMEIAEKNIADAINGDSGDFIVKEIMEILPEYVNADANTYSNVLQAMMYGEIVYG
jgi:hypothetical protein